MSAAGKKEPATCRLQPSSQCIGSNRGITCCVLPYKGTHVTDYSAKPPSRYRVYSMSLADTSNTREPDHPVLQHWRPCSALGQAHLQASGATEPHRHGKLTPRPFNLVGNQASLGDESQLSDVSLDRLSAPFLYGFHDPRFTRCDNSNIGGVERPVSPIALPMWITQYRTNSSETISPLIMDKHRNSVLLGQECLFSQEGEYGRRSNYVH